jgi:hypothetical protein
MACDEGEARLGHPWPIAIEECQLPDGREHRTLVDHLLDAMQDRLTLLGIELRRLLPDKSLDVGIAAVGEGASCSDEGVEASGGVARGAARGLDDVLQLLVAVLRDERCALQRAESRPDADRVQIVNDGFSEIRVPSLPI